MTIESKTDNKMIDQTQVLLISATNRFLNYVVRGKGRILIVSIITLITLGIYYGYLLLP